jgi:carbamoyl-phosphate synthase large subunit
LDNKTGFLDSCKKIIALGLKIYATEKTSKFLKENNVANTRVYKISEKQNPSVLDLMREGKVDFVININEQSDVQADKDGRIMRRTCVDLGIPLMTNLQAAIAFCQAISVKKLEDLEIKAWDEYVKTARSV